MKVLNRNCVAELAGVRRLSEKRQATTGEEIFPVKKCESKNRAKSPKSPGAGQKKPINPTCMQAAIRAFSPTTRPSCQRCQHRRETKSLRARALTFENFAGLSTFFVEDHTADVRNVFERARQVRRSTRYVRKSCLETTFA